LAQADEVLVSEPVVEHVSRSRALPAHCRSRDDLRVLRRTSSDSPVWQVEFAR
jgi:hypothetical protein